MIVTYFISLAALSLLVSCSGWQTTSKFRARRALVSNNKANIITERNSAKLHPIHGKSTQLSGSISDWLLSYDDYGMVSMTDKFTIDNAFVPAVGILVLSAITFALTKSRQISADFPEVMEAEDEGK